MSSLLIGNRIKESTTTTGTGNVTLAGALTGYAGLISTGPAVGDKFDYCIYAVDSNGNPTGDWEVGQATVVSSSVFSRSVESSSNSNALVSFAAGTKHVILSPTAARFRDRINVKIFGAKGDGTTADADAIALATLYASKVYIPAGVYYVDKSIQIPANCTLEGEGGFASILKRNATGTIGASQGIIFCNSGSAATQIEGISLKGIGFSGQTNTLGFSENNHLVSLHGLKNVLIEGCSFTGFQGSAIMIGSGDAAGQERHNKNINIQNCFFDGLNKENRNAVWIVDCDGALIQGNFITRCSKSTMPGPISVEPDASVLRVVRHIRVDNNYFYDCGGSYSAVSILLSAADFNTPAQYFSVTNNHFEKLSNNCVTLLTRNTIQSVPHYLEVIGNQAEDVQRPFDIRPQGYGVTITNNQFNHNGIPQLGSASSDVITNALVSANVFKASASSGTSRPADPVWKAFPVGTIPNSAVSIATYGGVPGASAATIQSALNSAFAALPSGGTIRIPAGTYNLGTMGTETAFLSISGKSNYIIQGYGGTATFVVQTTASVITKVFDVINCSNINFENMAFQDTGFSPSINWKGAFGFDLGNDSTVRSGFRARNITATNCVGVLRFFSSGSTSNLKFSDLYISCTANQCYYGVNINYAAYDMQVVVTSTDIRRAYIGYGNHDLDLTINYTASDTSGSYNANALCELATGGGNDVYNVTARATCTGLRYHSSVFSPQHQGDNVTAGNMNNLNLWVDIRGQVTQPSNGIFWFSHEQGGVGFINPTIRTWTNCKCSGTFDSSSKTTIGTRGVYSTSASSNTCSIQLATPDLDSMYTGLPSYFTTYSPYTASSADGLIIRSANGVVVNGNIFDGMGSNNVSCGISGSTIQKVTITNNRIQNSSAPNATMAATTPNASTNYVWGNRGGAVSSLSGQVSPTTWAAGCNWDGV